MTHMQTLAPLHISGGLLMSDLPWQWCQMAASACCVGLS